MLLTWQPIDVGDNDEFILVEPAPRNWRIHMFGRSMNAEVPALYRVRVETKLSEYVVHYATGKYEIVTLKHSVGYMGPYSSLAAAKGVATSSRPRRPDDDALSDSFSRVAYDNTFVTIEKTEATWGTVFTYE